jgi:deoxyribodipyrimidine photo-lyase
VNDRPPTTIVWFRRDLRLADHPALTAAVERGAVVACFVLDDDILRRRHHHAPARLRFLRAGLESLDASLRERGSRLIVRHGDPAEVVPRLAQEAGADRVACLRETSPRGRARDERVAAALAAAGVHLDCLPGTLAVEPEALPGPDGAGYRVFTPFFRAWSAAGTHRTTAAPSAIPGPDLGSMDLNLLPAGRPPLPGGEVAAEERLERFIHDSVKQYSDTRNVPGDDGTSHLSAYLRLGMISPQAVRAALGRKVESRGGGAFWRQMAWRDFYHHVQLHHPHTARGAMRPEFDHIAWDGGTGAFDAWRHGETGFPLVDAGMRQLAAEAWMHNRTRMVTASFLVKDLIVDWRRGETHFMRELVDGDPANNNGGWQWVAGTGTDAAPYFRVLNPTLQAQKFDPDGHYIRRYVPELRDVPDRFIHAPWQMGPEDQRAASCRIGHDYPAPIVDHAARRVEVLERYKAAQGSGGTGTGRPSSSTATRTK